MTECLASGWSFRDEASTQLIVRMTLASCLPRTLAFDEYDNAKLQWGIAQRNKSQCTIDPKTLRMKKVWEKTLR
jgi:hypothetical protein